MSSQLTSNRSWPCFQSSFDRGRRDSTECVALRRAPGTASDRCSPSLACQSKARYMPTKIRMKTAPVAGKSQDGCNNYREAAGSFTARPLWVESVTSRHDRDFQSVSPRRLQAQRPSRGPLNSAAIELDARLQRASSTPGSRSGRVPPRSARDRSIGERRRTPRYAAKEVTRIIELRSPRFMGTGGCRTGWTARWCRCAETVSSSRTATDAPCGFV